MDKSPQHPNLRAVGTTFKYVTPPPCTYAMNGLSSSVTTAGDSFSFTLTTYKILEHVRTVDGWGEVVHPIAIEKYPAKGWRSYCGMVSAIPPDELLKFLPSDWKAPVMVSSIPAAESSAL